MQIQISKVYVVRAEHDGMPESYLAGIYPTRQLALDRIEALEVEGYTQVWYDEVDVGVEGGDCLFSNR